jgi:hypothetical protein
MNSDANPILTLAWTFGVMSLFAARMPPFRKCTGLRSMFSTG